MYHLILFFSNMIYIFFKAFQQLNVVHDNKKLVIPVSVMMSLCEVTTVVILAKEQNFIYFLPMGVGAGIGCLLAMYTHKTLREDSPPISS